MPECEVVVVGLGAMGSAALHHLARRGRKTIGIERARPAHEGGSSHGESRVIRLAYFEHPSYVPLVRRAYENWRELEKMTGQQVLTVTGVLEAGAPGGQLLEGSLRSCREHGLPHERLSGAEVARRFPAFTLPPDWEALFQPDGGFLRPELAIDLHLKTAVALGAEVRIGAGVRALEPRARGVSVVLSDGGRIEAEAVILAAGAWMSELVPGLAPHLSLTRQTLAWFQPSAPGRVAPGAFPVFLIETGEDLVYGFPDFAGTGVKAASHLPGRRLARADDARQDATPGDAGPVARALKRFVPAAHGALKAQKTCIYTSTPDGDFVLGPHPEWPQLLLASPCSGHGFKFASAIGKVLADLATEGASAHDISRFDPARFEFGA